jgi:hypothetical protein
MRKFVLALIFICACFLFLSSNNAFAFSLIHDLPYQRSNGVTYTDVIATRDDLHTYYAYYDIPVNGSIPDITRYGFDWGISFGCNGPACTYPGYHLYMITCDQNNNNCVDVTDTGTDTQVIGSAVGQPTCWDNDHVSVSREFMWYYNYLGLCGVGDVTAGSLYGVAFIIVDSGAEWRYSATEQAGWTEISFDDSQWNIGITPFDDHSVTGWCAFGGNGTNWPLNTSLYLRKDIDVKQQGDLTVRIAIDNDFVLYFDGNEVAALNSEFCPYKWQYEYNIPSVDAGAHTVAVKIMDRGDDNGFDMMVSQRCEAPPPPASPNLEVSPSSHNFGEVTIGECSEPQQFTLSNIGNADLNVTHTALSDNTNFVINFVGGDNPCAANNPPINPGQSCTITVKFCPSTGGIINANLTIDSNDPDTPTSNNLITGIGESLILFSEFIPAENSTIRGKLRDTSHIC